MTAKIINLARERKRLRYKERHAKVTKYLLKRGYKKINMEYRRGSNLEGPALGAAFAAIAAAGTAAIMVKIYEARSKE